MIRRDNRQPHEIRPVRITRPFLRHPEGSVLVEVGDTHVICTASVEERVPLWLKNSSLPGGWITAEYGMLPRSTHTRTSREANRTSGRTMEIQRLIGRSLRAVVDLSLLGERTLWMDCDVIQADGGTRTAAITGSFVALVDALLKLGSEGKLAEWPVKDFVAAVSAGIVNGQAVLDLDYEEDSRADVDLNLVMTGSGTFVEIQATGERATLDRASLDALLGLGGEGIRKVIEAQGRILGQIHPYRQSLPRREGEKVPMTKRPLNSIP